ncbi:RNA-directed DNA polymerase, partial [Thiolapillus sp.]|uniref:RNA-directed DNA polymerase n=1 Tax=Thiolapillus sp. TaxID=2017437 RepID=UPI003AF5DEC5
MKNKKNDHRKSQIGLLLSVANDPQAFWNQIRRHRRKPTVTNSIPKDDWYAHFENLFNSGVENLPSENSENEGESSAVDEFLDSDISEEEVKAAIRHLKNNKSPGPDGIMSEILKALDTAIVPFLVKYFNKLFSSGLYPTEWTKAIIVPLHKKGDINNVDNYRGISLLNVLSKIFTYIVNRRLTTWAESNNVISDAQAGFRTQYSTVDHIFTLYACVEKYMSCGGKFYVAYIDFCKAFDSVQHTLLWSVLFRTGVQGKMLRMLKSMYRTVQACVRCGSENTEYFTCLQGLKQGCLASPTLFSLFINELAHDIISQGKHGLQFSPNDIEIFIMLFADDIVLLSATIIGLQNQITALYNAANRLRLQVNLSKTK